MSAEVKAVLLCEVHGKFMKWKKGTKILATPENKQCTAYTIKRDPPEGMLTITNVMTNVPASSLLIEQAPLGLPKMTFARLQVPEIMRNPPPAYATSRPPVSIDEAIKQLVEAKAQHKALEFADENPHWWIGVNSDGKFWWSYYCCEACEERDHETFDTPEALAECAGKDGDWVRLEVSE